MCIRDRRNNSNEVMISNSNKKLNDLVPGSIVGTSSFRREFQLKRIRKDLNFKLIRGNVDTRIKKLKNGEYDAIVLAKAGLSSLNLDHEITQEFSNNELIPSAGQGTITIQCRKDDPDIIIANTANTALPKVVNIITNLLSNLSER